MKILIGCNDFKESNLNKQPWVYIFKIAQYLLKTGKEVVIVTTGNNVATSVGGVPVEFVEKIFTPLLGESKQFMKIVDKINPDYIVMIMGLTSFLRFRFDLKKPVIGIVTSPVYTVKEIYNNVGLWDSIYHFDLIAIHYLNSIIPNFFIKNWSSKYNKIIVLSEWNQNRLVGKGVQKERIRVIPPSIDAVWLGHANKNISHLCDKSRDEIKKIVYYTAPLSLRGCVDLIYAFNIVNIHNNAHLKFICRLDSKESIVEMNRLKAIAKKIGIYNKIDFILKNVSVEDLKLEMVESDVVCLPFKIVISDVPLSLLEVMATGTPLISTSVGSIPQLLKEHTYCVKPNNPEALASGINLIFDNYQQAIKHGACRRFDMKNHPSWDDVGYLFSETFGEQF